MERVFKADLGVSFELLKAWAEDSGIGEPGLKLFFSQFKDFLQINLCSVAIEFELFVFTYWCIFLIRTGKDTFLAAEESVTYFFG